MNLSEELEAAIADKVRLSVGQFIEVRTRDGDLVITGTIQQLIPGTNTIRISDTGSGSDVQVDVDPKLYHVWVRNMFVPGTSPVPSKQPEVNLKGSSPGAATLGKGYRFFQR